MSRPGPEDRIQPAGIDPLDPLIDQAGAARPALLDTSVPASRWPGGLVFLPLLGGALGPGGLAILTPGILDLIDPVIPVALAALGVLAGLDLGGINWSERRALAASAAHGVVTAAAVGAATLLLGPVLGVASIPTWILAVVAGICAATSGPPPGARVADAPSPTARLRELDNLLPILLGAFVLAWLRESSVAAAWLTAQSAAVTLVIAVAGWLLLYRPSSHTEQRIFTVATVLLVGGAADYLSMSALFCGLIAGVFWRRAGGLAPESVRRDVIHVRRPLLALLLIVAGARIEISAGVLALGIAYALVRTAGALAAGSLGSRMAEGTTGATRAGAALLSPGMLGVAFVLNTLRAAGPDMAQAVAVVVIGTVTSQVFALVLRPGEAPPMMRALALTLVVAAVLWLQHLGETTTVASAGTALALGFALLGAGIVGHALERFHLPKLTGYLLFGVLVGPYLGNVITESMAGQLRVVTGIATTLIALIAGLTLSLNRLGPRLIAIVYTTGTTLAVVMSGIAAVAWIVWPWLPIAPQAAGFDRLSIVALLAIMIASFSPTMTAAVITETGARGRLSELVLAVVVLADLTLLVVFSLTLPVARIALGTGIGDGTILLARLAWEIGGAVAFGVLLGSLFALYLRYVGREVTLVLIAVCGVLSQVGSTQQFEPLLAAVAAGLVIENLSIAQGDALKAAVQRGATPVLVIFFASVGASLRLDALGTIGVVALLASLLRLGLIRLGMHVGVRASGLDRGAAGYAWTGLISQAGITLGFASVVAAEFPAWGPQLQILIVALIALHELAGPLWFRHGLARAGELEQRAPRPLVVVSNREPYLHRRTDAGEIVATPATGGVAVALDALMRERNGVWIAHGAGDADRLVVDSADRVRVPPQRPSYDLRRLWIEEPTFSSYYGGFANEGLWPLCHQVDVRPKFRSEDWAAYRDVNERFAAAIDEELRSPNTPVFIQDYHLALVAPALRARRPDARTALFWHIPWPYPDRLRICPWRREILAGLLGNDLLAFQLERDRRHFLTAAAEELDADVEIEASRVRFAGRESTVVAVPIGVDYDRIQQIAAEPGLAAEQQRLRDLFCLRAEIVGVGVDRLDYTKGIPERLAALDQVMCRRPDLRGRLTFVQIGVPSRSELDSYAAIESEVSGLVADVNARHAMPGRPPLVSYHTRPLTMTSLVALYRMADFCIVSSLHDGMNLVAKEYVAARDDGGVLVLSALAGAAQELRDALIINPYDVDGFAGALVTAIEMPAEERAARMRAMRRVVAGRNVFGWASDILEGLESLWTKPLHYSVRGWESTPV